MGRYVCVCGRSTKPQMRGNGGNYSAAVTLPVWRDITSLNHLERGEEGGRRRERFRKGEEKRKI